MPYCHMSRRLVVLSYNDAMATTLEYMYNHNIYVEALPSIFTTYGKRRYHSDERESNIESAVGRYHIEIARALSTVS